MMNPSCLIVMYHYIGNYEAYPGIHGLSELAFAQQVDRLCAAMEPIDWPTLYAWTQGKGSIPERCFLLTFDDGLVGQDRRVCPRLAENGIRGTFLVPGAVLTGNVLLPAHAIHLLLSRVPAGVLENEIIAIASGSVGLSMADAEVMYQYEPLAVVARVKYLLTVALPREERSRIIRRLFAKHIGSIQKYARGWYMNVTDLRRMQAAGHTIGGHGYSHEPYNTMSRVEQADDIRKVAATLKAGFDDAVPQPRPFSYPYGQCPEGTSYMCKGAGFAGAFTTERRWADDSCGPFRMPRVDAMYLEANNDAGFTVAPKATDDPVPAVSGIREDR
jgi:peptidoglycan/xylan/chitin deacetylase (PgdA/CDA1 family)